MSKMKRAMFFKDKFILDDKTVYHVVDVRLEPRQSRYKVTNPRLYLTMIMQDMSDNTEFWHIYEDSKRKKNYIVVASLAGKRLGNGDSD